jgi:predicted lipoprotein with Yx(FWY)xxD motif
VRVRTRLLPSVAAAALLLTACDADGVESPGQEDGVEEIDTEDTDEADDIDGEETDDTAGTEDDDLTDDQAAAGDVVIEAQESDLGTHLVDGEGATLYLSVLDGEEESTCTSDCTQLWQPVLVDGEPEAGDGVDGSLLGSFEREDDLGTQVTYDGMPLYRFVADDAGDTNGHGLADRWFAVDVDGGAIGGAEITGPPAEEADEADAEGDDEDDTDEDDTDEDEDDS